MNEHLIRAYSDEQIQCIVRQFGSHNYKNEINYVREGIAAKFDVLTTRLDLKIADFQSRLPANKPTSKTSKSLKKPQPR